MAQQWLFLNDPFFQEEAKQGIHDESGWIASTKYAGFLDSAVSPETWKPYLQALGYTGPLYEQVGWEGGEVQQAILAPSQEFKAFVAQKQAEGYGPVVEGGTKDKEVKTFGFRLPSGEVINQVREKVSGFGDFFKEFVLPSVGAYFGAGALGNALAPVTNALTGVGGAGGAAGAIGAGIAEGMAPGVLAPASAAELGAVNALTGAGGTLTAADLTNLPTDILGSGGDVAAGAVGEPDLYAGFADLGVPADPALAAGMGVSEGMAAISPSLVDRALSLINTPAGQAVLGAAGSVVGGVMEANAAERAAETQSQAAQNALQLQRDMFEYQKSLLEPYRTAGTKALERLSGAMGLGGPGSQQQMLEMDPGYGFRLGEGLKALERMQASRGNFLSGGALKAGQRFAQDTASQEYDRAFGRLADIAGIGRSTGTQLGTAGTQYASSAGNIIGQEANALAAGRAARGSAYSNAIGGALGSYQNYLNRQQEERLIRDIFGRTIGG